MLSIMGLPWGCCCPWPPRWEPGADPDVFFNVVLLPPPTEVLTPAAPFFLEAAGTNPILPFFGTIPFRLTSDTIESIAKRS